MIKAFINSKATLTIEPGSVVIISEGQFKALGDKAVAYKDEAKEEAKEEENKEEPKKTTTSKKTSGKKK